tara:strand:- start:100 stop:897 length:798 start_codon:yes stop_codon:yes gene_type:complete
MGYNRTKDRDIKEQVTYNLINVVKCARKKHHYGSQYNIKNLLILPSIGMLDLRVMKKLKMVGKRTNIVAVEKEGWIASDIRTKLRAGGYKNVTVICSDLNNITKEKFQECAPNGFDFAYLDSCSEPTDSNMRWLTNELKPSLAKEYFLASNWAAADRQGDAKKYQQHHAASAFCKNDHAGKYANAVSLALGESVYDMISYKEKGKATPMNLCLQTNYSDDCKFDFNFDLRNIGYKDQRQISTKLLLDFVKIEDPELFEQIANGDF